MRRRDIKVGQDYFVADRYFDGRFRVTGFRDDYRVRTVIVARVLPNGTLAGRLVVPPRAIKAAWVEDHA